MQKESKWVFILNPVAGKGSAIVMLDKLKEMLLKHQIAGEFVFTEKPGHAGELSEKYSASGYTHIIGVGGDGTFNEIASRLVGRKDIITGLIPAGTGNDFVQILGYPDRFTEENWNTFFEVNTILMDAGRCNGKFFFNGMGLGFDAQVAAQNYSAPGEVRQGGKNKYVWHILKTLLFYREKRMTVLSGDEKFETDCFINTVSVGRRFAGAFLLTPEAIANDGMLDVCSIKKLSLFQRLRILLMVPKGTHIKDKRVNYYQVRKIDLEFPYEVPFHVDGELNFSKKFKIEILPEAINIIYNPKGRNFFKNGQN